MIHIGDDDLREMLQSLDDAAANKAVHEKEKRELIKAHIDSKRKVTESERSGSSASGSLQSTKRKKQT
jgi:hypothetical protein